MTTQVYATQVTAYFLAAQAAYQASGGTGTPLNIAGGTLVVGDGSGAVPSISALIAANGVTHEVWRGQTINSVSVDPNNPDQLDIACEIPAAIGGAEIGPFTVTEFAILDALGNCCVVGTTNLQKTVSSQGQTSDLAWIAAVVYSVANSVVVTPPNGGYATMAQVIAGYDANLPDCTAPITKTDTLRPSGWIYRVFGIAPAAQPADAVTPTSSANAMGSGRPASAQEWANGAPTAGGFAWPWPTLQQVTAALAAITTLINGVIADLAGYLLKSGGTMTGFLVLNADPTVAAHAATKRYVDNSISGVAIPDVSGFVHRAGDTMTGPLITARDPQSGLEVANKEYVDGKMAVPVFPAVGSFLTGTEGSISGGGPSAFAISMGAPAGSVWINLGRTGVANASVGEGNGGAMQFVPSDWWDLLRRVS